MTTTAQERTLPSTNEIVEIDLDLIDPNPWQPRLRSDPKALAELVENIHQLGRLLQMPMARPSPDAADRFQLAFGHRRVDGLQVLRSRGDWGDTVTVVLADLTDAEMAYYALGRRLRLRRVARRADRGGRRRGHQGRRGPRRDAHVPPGGDHHPCDGRVPVRP